MEKTASAQSDAVILPNSLAYCIDIEIRTARSGQGPFSLPESLQVTTKFLEESMRQTTFRLSNLLGCLTLIVLLSVLGQAQFRAGVQGVVTDNAGGVVPGANITLTNKETNQARTTQSSEEGF